MSAKKPKIIEPAEQPIEELIPRPPSRPVPKIVKPEAEEEKVTPATVKQKLDSVEDVPALWRGVFRVWDKSQRIRPGFSSSWVVPVPPYEAELVKEYTVSDAKVALYKLPNETDSLYYVMPSEYKLPLKHVELVNLARAKLTERCPEGIQLTRPEQARKYVLDESIKITYELARERGIELGKTRAEEIETAKKLSAILAKYTAGMGVTEVFLTDPYIQDIYIDAPASENRVHVTIGGVEDPRLHDKCITNVTLSDQDAESLLSRFRYESGRSFSEAFPVLECDLDAYTTRVTVIGKPLSHDGTALALRRHSTAPWTLLRFIQNKSLSPLAAGLISFLIDGKATMLIAGSRGSGKTSLLGATMLEFPQSQRILTVEDTLELPGPEMQQLGYKVQGVHVRSALGGRGEMTADDALRVTLRLGESAIVMGEVRGKETRTLYEAMRAGTAGSSVLGTIHANTAKAVYERVVYDMGIPAKSFNATDIVIITGLTRPGGVQKQIRRVTQISELVKEGPKEGEFQDLMLYDPDKDSLVETEALKKSEKLRDIARSWGITVSEAIQNITARAAIRKAIVEYAEKHNKPKLLSAEWVVKSNNAFWKIAEELQSAGKIDYQELLRKWNRWFTESAAYA